MAEFSNPDFYASAMASNDADKWKQAMDEEMNSLQENETWDLVELPQGNKVITYHWVLRIKTKSDGSIYRYKTRLAAKGYSQKQGIDYDETFSPVARFDTVRMIISISASENLKFFQFDVKTAFLYGELQEEAFMKQPIDYDA
ncbi:Retrovirus-related Pol polyprotein from transposon TNT 1-94 [Araneus ventricosus]|uniref:Retrovirus-related Pol polyprotein from transposon TNT 1-94 n=1 Tax=Araneus ventricosus TaxID=182803 RepID=A0A4Y2LCP6_ARAVE|nr:Retrovirus-related Pol polyprotein from transposon TNT 1-94 [Araneus ventricosus]